MRRDAPPPSFRDVIIFDTGGHTIKCGLASDPSDEPRLVPNCLGRLKGDRASYVGDGVTSCRDAATLNVRRPVDRGYVCAWALQRDVWSRAAKHVLGQSKPQIRSSLLLATEPPFTLQAIRRAAAEAALLELGVAGVVFASTTELVVAAACLERGDGSVGRELKEEAKTMGEEGVEGHGGVFSAPLFGSVLDGLERPETDPEIPFLASIDAPPAPRGEAARGADGSGRHAGGADRAVVQRGRCDGPEVPSPGAVDASEEKGQRAKADEPTTEAVEASAAGEALVGSPSRPRVPRPLFEDVLVLAQSCGCALVVDAGFSFCHAAAAFEGRPLPAATVRVDVGGKALTNALADALSLRSVNVRGQPLLVDRIKEALCFVSSDPTRDLARCGRRARGRSPFRAQYVLPDGVRDPWGRVRGAPGAREPDETESVASLDAERFAVPELLFSPADVGLGECGLAEAAARAAQRAHPALRPLLLGHVLLVGGSAAMPGFARRFARELRALVPDALDLRVRPAAHPVAAAYRGARILAKRPEALTNRAITAADLAGGGGAWERAMDRALGAAADAPAWNAANGPERPTERGNAPRPAIFA